MVVGANHLDAVRGRWGDLFWPVTESTPNRWRFDNGLGVWLVSQSNDGFVALVSKSNVSIKRNRFWLLMP
jgi:hypothetical protein